MKLMRVNDLLLIAIIIVNGYIILAPALPQITYGLRAKHAKPRLIAKIQAAASSTTPEPLANQGDQANQVIVPSMILDQPILEGSIPNRYKTLDHGIWRWPHGSTPDKGGNTILIGHRFTYTNPKGVFYYLDKVKIGDEIGLLWNHKTYTYAVNTIREVDPSDVSIENPTTDSRLTMFTCTPLWLPRHRLVITAQLERS